MPNRPISPVRFVAAPSVARALQQTYTFGPYFNTDGYRGIRLYISVSAVTSSPSVVFSVQQRDPASGTYKILTGASSAAVTGTTTGATLLDVYPGEVAVANEVVNRHIGGVFRIGVVHSNTDSITYTVAVEWLP